MNSERQQRQMAEVLKNDIKRNAAHRREKVNASSTVTHDATIHHFNVIPNMLVSSTLFSIEPTDDTILGDQTSTPASDVSASHGPAPSNLLPCGHQQHRCSSGMEQPSVIETDFIMKYFDFVFPTLFPFYRPNLFETGRTWLLLLLGKSKIAYHSTLSLSSYFFTMALAEADSGKEYAGCSQLRWKELEQQTNKCYDSIRTDILTLDLNSQGSPATKLEKVEIMASIIQVLIFDIVLGKSALYNSHFVAAIALFEEIMACSRRSHQDQGQSKLALVLLEIGQPSWTRPGYSSHVWSPDQAGFRFCAGLLVFIDVVASTAIQKPPRLLSYHPDILARIDEGAPVVSDAEVRLSNTFGCRNWVIRSIAEISALDSWKQEQSKANSLSVVEVVDRASAIANELRNGILGIQTCQIATSPSSLNHYTPLNVHPSPFASVTSTLIWAHAAQLYLSVVVSGWQLSNTEVRANVAQIIGLLQDVPAYQLRALAWPLCVTGCLALESEESSFSALFSNQGKVYTAGALDDTQQILEQVWQTRTILRPSTWNLASCLSILGSPVLLV